MYNTLVKGILYLSPPNPPICPLCPNRPSRKRMKATMTLKNMTTERTPSICKYHSGIWEGGAVGQKKTP